MNRLIFLSRTPDTPSDSWTTFISSLPPRTPYGQGRLFAAEPAIAVDRFAFALQAVRRHRDSVADRHDANWEMYDELTLETREISFEIPVQFMADAAEAMANAGFIKHRHLSIARTDLEPVA